MRTSRLILPTVGIMAFAFITGCATTPKGPSDTVLIKQVMNNWSAALVAKNIDKVMSYYSDKFQSSEWGDKAGMRNFFKNEAVPMHYLDGIKVDLQNAKIKIKKNTADVEPIDVAGNFGDITLQATFKKEKGVWKVIGLEED